MLWALTRLFLCLPLAASPMVILECCVCMYTLSWHDPEAVKVLGRPVGDCFAPPALLRLVLSHATQPGRPYTWRVP